MQKWLVAGSSSALIGVAACGTANYSSSIYASGSGGIGNATGAGGSDAGAFLTHPQGPIPKCDAALDGDPPGPVTSNDADASAGCHSCGGAGFNALLSARQVAQALGSSVKFLKFDWVRHAIVAEIADTHENVLVDLPLVLSCGDVGFKIRRLPTSVRQWILKPGLLTCSQTECRLLRTDAADTENLEEVPGGAVPEGFIGTFAVDTLSSGTCVSNEASPPWCFKDASWNRLTASTSGSLTITSTGDQRSSAAPQPCATPSAFSGELQFWAKNPYDTKIILGATDTGEVVKADWNDGASCCCALTPPLGAAADLVVSACGIFVNWMLLTETTVWGTSDCGID